MVGVADYYLLTNNWLSPLSVKVSYLDDPNLDDFIDNYPKSTLLHDDDGSTFVTKSYKPVSFGFLISIYA
jgi:hypothetical protein